MYGEGIPQDKLEMRPLIKKDLKEVLDHLRRRESWPVAMLAEELGCTREGIYRRVRRGDFPMHQGRVPTEAVIEALEED